jgi:Holliday junction resolvasome RuvABC endonuclease subunit
VALLEHIVDADTKASRAVPRASAFTVNVPGRGAGRLVQIHDALHAALVRIHADARKAACIEGLSYDSTSRLADLGELHGVVKCALVALGVPCFIVPPATLKRAAGGSNFSKYDMYKAFRKRLHQQLLPAALPDWLSLTLPEAELPAHYDDFVDALWLARVASCCLDVAYPPLYRAELEAARDVICGESGKHRNQASAKRKKLVIRRVTGAL